MFLWLDDLPRDPPSVMTAEVFNVNETERQTKKSKFNQPSLSYTQKILFAVLLLLRQDSAGATDD